MLCAIFFIFPDAMASRSHRRHHDGSALPPPARRIPSWKRRRRIITPRSEVARCSSVRSAIVPWPSWAVLSSSTIRSSLPFRRRHARCTFKRISRFGVGVKNERKVRACVSSTGTIQDVAVVGGCQYSFVKVKILGMRKYVWRTSAAPCRAHVNTVVGLLISSFGTDFTQCCIDGWTKAVCWGSGLFSRHWK